MKTDHEVLAAKQQLEWAVYAVERAPERDEGKILMSKDWVLGYLLMGAELASELETLRASAGTLMEDIEESIEGESEDE